MAGAPRSLAHQTFGLWTVTDQFRRSAGGHRQWLCVCRCGSRQHIEASALTRGRSRSCGCVIPWWGKVVAGKEWNAAHAR